MVEPFEIEFFLNGRHRHLLCEGGLKVFDLLLLKVVGAMLKLTLKIFLSFVLRDLRVITHPLLSDHCFTVHTLGPIRFSFLPVASVIIILV